MSLEVVHTLYGGETVVLEMVKAVGKVMEEKRSDAFNERTSGHYFIVFMRDGLNFRCKTKASFNREELEENKEELEENRNQLVKKLEAYWRKTQ